MRTGLLELQKNHENITWTQIRRAYPHIVLINGHCAIKLHWHDHVLRWIVTSLCVLASIYSLLVILAAILGLIQTNLIQLLGLTGCSLLLLVAVMYFASLNWPYHAARIIDKAVRSGNR